MNNSITPLINFSIGDSSQTASLNIPSLSTFNLQSISKTLDLTILSKDIKYSYLTRLANYDIVLAKGMTMAQILTAIQIPALLTIDTITGKLVLDPTLRPLVVEGEVIDLPVLAALLGLENPQSCISGDSFSYPINGLSFPLPVSQHLNQQVVCNVSFTNGINTFSYIINIIPSTIDIGNRYVVGLSNVTSMTASFTSNYGFPLQLNSPIFAVFKLN